MIGRIGFWLVLPGLIATVVEIGALVSAAVGPRDDELADRVSPLIVAVVLVVLLVSLAIQALMIVRRPQTLTARQLPAAIAVPQLVLYAVVALWVALVTQTTIAALSVLFAVAVIGLSIDLLVQILGWPPAASAAAVEVDLPTVVRVALWTYCLLALVGLMYAVASYFTPSLDPTSNQAYLVLSALGLPFSILVMPIAVVALLAGYSIAFAAVASIGVLANVGAVLLVLWPRSRVRLVNWFFKLGRTPPTLEGGVERSPEVGDQVVGVFEADREA